MNQSVSQAADERRRPGDSDRILPFASRARAAAPLLFGLMLIGSCAKNPTAVLAEVSADGTVPPVLQLRTTLTLQADPSQVVVHSLSSLFRGDAADRPAPYQFPILVSIGAPPEWSGPVQVTIEGLDWDTNAVNATGTAPAETIAHQVTNVSITLTGVAIVDPNDGGVDVNEPPPPDPVDADDPNDAAVTDDVVAEDI